MNLSLTLVGAGEYTSLEEDTVQVYLRFRAPNGVEFNLPCTEEQLNSAVQFAAAQRQVVDPVLNKAAQVDTTESPPPPHARPVEIEPPSVFQSTYVQDAGDPNMVDDPDDDAGPGETVVLRSASPFATPGKDDPL